MMNVKNYTSEVKVLALDPGNKQTAYVLWDGKNILLKGIVPNENIIPILRLTEADATLIEMIASYGMPVGREVFDTTVWIGRFFQCRYDTTRKEPILVYRKDVKLHHCHSLRAKDSNIHQALIDKYGDKGTKKAPGITYGLSKDMWSAFAIATYFTETYVPERKCLN